MSYIRVRIKDTTLVMKRLLLSLAVSMPALMLCAQAPGAITTNLQTWFDANVGTVGTPVVTWNNQGPNTNITAVTSSNGGTLLANDIKSNFNNLISCTGGFAGTFHAEVPQRTDLISGNGVTMYIAYQRSNYPDLTFNFHSSVSGGGGDYINGWRSWGFRHGGIGSTYSSGTSVSYDAPMQSQMSDNAAFVGLYGTSNSAGGNTMNGIGNTTSNVGTFYSGSSDMELSIGYWPGYGMNRGVMEAIVWDRSLSTAERNRVESYLALKYGITLGMNGTAMNYVSPSSGAVIWTQAANAGYNNDIAGISRSDASGLNQTKSHSTNGATSGSFNDIVTVASGSNFNSPAAIGSDNTYLLWGHNGGDAINNGVYVNYPTDNTEVIQTIFQRHWKSQETGTLGTVTLEFDMSNVIGPNGVPGANDLTNVRLLVDEDGDFSNGATSLVPSSIDAANDLVYFSHDFITATANPLDQNRGFFFTLGSTDAFLTPLPVMVTNYEIVQEQCDVLLTWQTVSERNNAYFLIERSNDLLNWERIKEVKGMGSSEEMMSYAYTDRSNKLNGELYYRVSQFDFDGTQEYLFAKSVNYFCTDFEEPQVYPNPTNGKLFIDYAQTGKFTVADLNGREIISQQPLNMDGTIVDLSTIASGVYVIHIETTSNGVFTERFVKR